MTEPIPKGERPIDALERSQIEARSTLTKGRELNPQTEDFEEQIGELFRADITEDLIEREKRSLCAWSTTIYNEETRHGEKIRIKPDTLTDELATTAVILRRARSFWNHGLTESTTPSDIDTWLNIVATPTFASLADRASIYPREALPDEHIPPNKLGSKTNGRTLFETIVRIGGNDQTYLGTMADRMATMMGEEPTEGLQPLRWIAGGVMQVASKLITEPSRHIQLGGRRPTETTPKAPTDELLFARMLMDRYEVNRELKPLRSPADALARVEFLEVNATTAPVFESSREDFATVLKPSSERVKQRDTMEYMRGGSRLLFNALNYAASPTGIGSENALKMRDFLAQSSEQKGRVIIPTRRAIVTLANALGPQLREILGEQENRRLSVDVPMDTLSALDQLFAFIEYEAFSKTNPEAAELIGAVADCSLQLASYGLTKGEVIIPPRPEQTEEPLLAGESGPKNRFRMLKRLGIPGYGKIS